MKRYIKMNISVPDAQNISGAFKQVFRDKVKPKDNPSTGKMELNDCTFSTENWTGKKFISANGEPVTITAWIVDASANLFKFKDEWEWISGSVRLWEVGTDVPITKENYMSISYQEMTDVAPIVEEE